MTDFSAAVSAIEKVIARYDTWLEQDIATEERFEFLNKKFGAIEALKAVLQLKNE